VWEILEESFVLDGKIQNSYKFLWANFLRAFDKSLRGKVSREVFYREKLLEKLFMS
jgi:hypothetical protein